MIWLVYVAQVLAGLVYSNLFEWVVHKYVLHEFGKKTRSFWSFHWGEHHRNVRRNQFYDPDYKRSIFSWNAQSKEVLGLVLGGVAHLPVFFVAPVFYITLIYCGFNYYVVHKKCHLNPEWAKRHVPWHYDHHMGANQNANWCVTRPWFDWVFRTRISFLKNPQGPLLKKSDA